jgi:hypothetical protein
MHLVGYLYEDYHIKYDKRSWNGDLLEAGRSGVRSPMEARDFLSFAPL